MKKLILLACFLHCVFNTSAQAPTLEWQKTFGGTGDDYAQSFEQTSDGGYILAGMNSSVATPDFWILKLDSLRNVQWKQLLGGEAWDWAQSVKPTTDGGYIVAGYTSSDSGDVQGNHGLYDGWLVKLTGNGAVSWTRTYGGPGNDVFNSIEQTKNGGYIIAGASDSINGGITGTHGHNDFWVSLLDKNADYVWTTNIGGTGDDEAQYAQQTFDGGYIVAGFSSSGDDDVTGNHGNFDYWIVKMTTTGNIKWQKSLGGPAMDKAYSIEQTTDSGYIVAGITYSVTGDVSGNHGGADAWVVKLDGLGNIVWQKCLGGSSDDGAYSVRQTTDGGYIVGGYSASTDGDVTGNKGAVDFWFVKLDAGGNIQWQKTAGGNGYDYIYAVRQTADGNYVGFGPSNSTNGDITNHVGGYDYWLVKIVPGIATGMAEPGNGSELVSVYPNPFSAHGTIETSIEMKDATLKMFDITGREVFNMKNISGSKIILERNELPPGLYVMKLQDAEGYSIISKIMVE